jgi:CRP/FNR family transcriptional regulator, dissimilatory nitrate respiration regulator
MRREPELAAFLRHLSLFEGLSADELARVAAGTTRRRLRRGEVLFRQGEPATGFHAVVNGRIALTARSAGGTERVTDIIEAGRCFGEAIMFLD